ncbi:hypothetical protein [Amycolatopsis kentuckyensis]|uniref:hypothetical protein n=1 Tax=Amycolatopsis kentuckyensis TaxID=218823 RepID=UPI000A3B6F27|nr:hypothetical protein [Amycolatopsis kentuckyensis]
MNDNRVAEGQQVDVLRKELNELRRGRGLDSLDVVQRIGPSLRAKIDVRDGDSPSAVRDKLILAISRICDHLPPDLRLAALTAFGIQEQAAGDFLDRRISWLAGALDRDPRTARRRIDAAFDRIAETISRTGPAGQDDDPYAGWSVEALKVLVRMDTDPLTLMEERRIIATRDDLAEISLQFSVPGVDLSDQKLEIVDMLFGGEVVARKNITRSYRNYTIRLPRPLRIGQTHEYAAQITLPSGTRVRPQYIFSPFHRVDHFDARVKFDRERRPAAVWSVDGMPAGTIEEIDPLDHPVEVDRIGEVHLKFDSLRPGLMYGLCWSDTASG